MFSKEETFALLEDEEALIANGFDEAIIGITFGSNMITVCSVKKAVDILMEEDEMCTECYLSISNTIYWLLCWREDTSVRFDIREDV